MDDLFGEPEPPRPELRLVASLEDDPKTGGVELTAAEVKRRWQELADDALGREPPKLSVVRASP
jgi:hypothetical protein